MSKQVIVGIVLASAAFGAMVASQTGDIIFGIGLFIAGLFFLSGIVIIVKPEALLGPKKEEGK